MSPMIQVAGIKNLAEAEMIVDCGVEYLGFPLRLPVNKPDLSEAEAAEVIRALGDRCKSVLITYLDEAKEISSFMELLGTNYVQLHGAIAAEELRRLRTARPEIFVIKSLVVRVGNEASLAHDVKTLSSYVDAFITDTFDPKTGATGATGKTHDWNVSKRLVQLSPKPVILAGGINPANVREAIEFVRPAGVDTHTGVEDRDGKKNWALVEAFAQNAATAFSAIK